MGAFTSSQSGNWNASSTWGGAGIPGSGDTATIANGHTVTVPNGYTAIIGTSPTNDTGTVALKTAGTGGTGVLVVAGGGTFKWQGPVRQGNAVWTFQAGSTCTYDASGAATPATALYTWQISDFSSQSATLAFSGSSGSHVTVNAVNNVASGGFGNTGTNWGDGGIIQATYTDFSYQGDPANLMVQGNYSTSVSNVFYTNCTFDHCSQISVSNLGGACIFDFRLNKVTNPSNTTYTLQINATTAKTTGTRRIENNDVAGQIYFLLTGSVNAGFTFLNNLNRPRDVTLSGGSSPVDFTVGGATTSYDQNFAYLCNGQHSADYSVQVPSGITCNNNAVLVVVDPTYANAHPIGGSAAGGDVNYQGWVIQYTGTDVAGDFFGVASPEASSDHNYKVTKCIFLPNASGQAVGSFINNSSGNNQAHTKIYFEHNTCAGATGTGNQVFGVGCEASTTWPAGAVPSIQSNILWSASSHTGLIANSASSATVTNGAVTTADYNNAFNISGSIYGIPAGQFNTTPGTHDLAVDPQFVDRTRNFLNADQGYLGRSVATAWVTSHAYNVGDLASNAVSAFFSNATFNYRCVRAHTSDNTVTQPGSGSAWQQSWEPAIVNEISTSILSGATFSGGTNSLVGEVVQWIKNGFVPHNAAIATAAHDGTTIGAMAYQASGGQWPWFTENELSGSLQTLGF